MSIGNKGLQTNKQASETFRTTAPQEIDQLLKRLENKCTEDPKDRSSERHKDTVSTKCNLQFTTGSQVRMDTDIRKF